MISLHNQTHLNTIQGIDLNNVRGNAAVKRIKLVVYEPGALSKTAETRKQFKDILLKQMNCSTFVANRNIFTKDRITETPTVIKYTEAKIQETTIPIVKKELPVQEVEDQHVNIEVNQPLDNELNHCIKSESDVNSNLMIAMRSDVPDEGSSDSIHSSLDSSDNLDEESMAINTLSYLMRKNAPRNSVPMDSYVSSQSSSSQSSLQESILDGITIKSKEYMRKRKIYKYDSEKERRENKRDQNKEAARRYREKKKTEVEIYEQKIHELEKINHQKQLELKALETEKRIVVEHLKRSENFFL